MSKVYILGGGVAGLTAAHELAQRNFDVVVFEKLPICGGKARSMAFIGSGTGGRPDWPGEHGFRFFPGFYFHLTDTMKRIVVDTGTGATADQNLLAATEIGIAQQGKPIHKVPATHPHSLEEWLEALQQLFGNPTLGVPLDEVRIFVRKLICFLGAGRTRRLTQYEGISWWDFIEADTKSQAYKDVLARGLSQSLVAMRPDKASTLTVASMLVQITVKIIEGAKGAEGDRVLNAPTSAAWITPWVAQLTGPMGVKIHNSHTAKRLNFDSATNRVTGVVVADGAGVETTWGTPTDHYIAAVPVEVVQKDSLLFPPSFKLAAGLNVPGPPATGVDQLDVEWMSGVLFYLNRDVSALHGHVIYCNSTWALTSIPQAQFWGGAFPWTTLGDGNGKDILSTIISDWNKPGDKTTTETARNSTRAEIIDEVWAQVKAHLAADPKGALSDGDRITTFIDPAIVFDGSDKVVDNTEPLLINTKHSRQHRPRAATNVQNFLVAADYVLTETDLACMEAANEAARAAVNEILKQTGSAETPCTIKPLKEPAVFEAFQKADELDFTVNPGLAPLLCRYLDQLVPTVSPSTSSDTVKWISIGLNIALAALSLYLLLKG